MKVYLLSLLLKAIFAATVSIMLMSSQSLAQEPVSRNPSRKDPAMVRAEMRSGGKVVKGAPFTASAVTESSHLLANGTRISQKSSAIVYRDGEGRTRREQAKGNAGPFADGGETPRMIFINDPVAGVAYTLYPDTRTGYKVSIPPAKIVIEPGDKPGRAEAEKSDKPPRPPRPPKPERRDPGAPKPKGTQVEHPSFIEDEGEGEVRNESLGKQTIDGFIADGEKSTVTIPVNRIGNDKPIVIVEERWKSPELRTTLISRTSDPRWGETTYKLTGIVRGEPDRALFQPPADYSIAEGKSQQGGKRRNPAKKP